MEQVKRSLKVAAYQMMVSADIDANYAAIKSGIEQAAKASAAFVVFPECALSGYPPLHHKNRDDIDMGKIAGRNSDVASLAGEFMVGVIYGTITERDGQLFNTAVVLDNAGKELGNYDKMHLFPGDSDFFAAGNKIPVFELAGAKVGVQICYDARFPEPFRYLKQQGVEIAVVISNACGSDTHKLPVLEGVYRARASENCFYVVAVNAAGPLQKALSRICDIEGISLVAAERDKSKMISADLNLNRISAGHFADLRTDIFELKTNLED